LGTGSPLVNEKEAGVFLAKGCKVSPNSVMRVGAQLSESMAGEYIVKAATKGELLIPRTLHKGGDIITHEAVSAPAHLVPPWIYQRD
jgi:hypothetical protein